MYLSIRTINIHKENNKVKNITAQYCRPCAAASWLHSVQCCYCARIRGNAITSLMLALSVSSMHSLQPQARFSCMTAVLYKQSKSCKRGSECLAPGSESCRPVNPYANAPGRGQTDLQRRDEVFVHGDLQEQLPHYIQ